MKEDETRWDKRYRTKNFPDTVNNLIRKYSHLANAGRALDIAAGNGRNAFYLAENGFDVEAVDISGVAIDMIQADNPKIECLHEDLDSFTPSPDRYNLVVNINYLNRRLFPHIKRALCQNGILIFKTFLDTHFLNHPQSSANRDHYLQSNELLNSFLPLQILYYSEEQVVWSNGEKRDEASLVARKIMQTD